MGQPLVADPFWKDLCIEGSEVNRNINGNWTRAELRQSAAIFNASRDPAERKEKLIRFFSANYTQKIRIGENVYVPERFADLERLFLRRCRKSALHLSLRLAGSAMILGDRIVAYNPPTAGPCLENAGASIRERVLEVPLEKIEKIVLRRDRLLFIQL